MSMTVDNRRKLLKRKRLKKERLLIHVLNEQKKRFIIRISTIKLYKPKISFLEGMAILIGTQIGAGVLGLPYAASRVGIFLASLILFGVMLLMLFTALIILKFSAEMGGMQMSTLAQKILGKAGGWFMYSSIVIMSFGALLAYISGMGSVFSNLLGIDEMLASILFWLFSSIVIYLGLEASGKTELVMSFIMLLLFISVVFMLSPYAKVENGIYTDFSGIFSMMGVAIFSLGCHTVIPDVYNGLGSYEKAKKAVILSFLIPAIIYAIFMAVFLFVFGRNMPQIATQGLESMYGRLGNIFGNVIPMIAITTSYIGVALAQQSNTKEFLRTRKIYAWAITAIPPLAIYLAGIRNFADVLAFAGDTGDMLAFIILPIIIFIVKKQKAASNKDIKS